MNIQRRPRVFAKQEINSEFMWWEHVAGYALGLGLNKQLGNCHLDWRICNINLATAINLIIASRKFIFLIGISINVFRIGINSAKTQGALGVKYV